MTRLRPMSWLPPVGEHRGEDVDHLPIAVVGAGELAPYALQRRRKHPILEGSAVAEGAGLAGEHRHVMPRVINRAAARRSGEDPVPRRRARQLCLHLRCHGLLSRPLAEAPRRGASGLPASTRTKQGVVPLRVLAPQRGRSFRRSGEPSPASPSSAKRLQLAPIAQAGSEQVRCHRPGQPCQPYLFQSDQFSLVTRGGGGLASAALMREAGNRQGKDAGRGPAEAGDQSEFRARSGKQSAQRASDPTRSGNFANQDAGKQPRTGQCRAQGASNRAQPSQVRGTAGPAGKCAARIRRTVILGL